MSMHSIPPARTVFPADSLVRRLHDLVLHGITFGADRLAAPDQAWWRTVAGTGTRPWLDTGDMDEAASLWCSSFAALTTNNTLLNKEVQKGLYDDLVKETATLTAELPERERIVEIGFVLNARHGLRLASRFGGRVSVELHTDLADDVERSVAYGRRFYAICPEHFIVKIPLTPSGLLATRRLRAEGIPVNFTLGFSARQNLIAAALSAPSYVNVFLGRLGAYVADNHLGEATNVGEKVTLASQLAVRQRTATRMVPTLQIAASMRNGAQVVALAGVDVHTMPPAAAKSALTTGGPVSDRTADDLPLKLVRDEELLAALWTVGPREIALADDLEQAPPSTPGDLVARCAAHGFGGLFPTFNPAEVAALTADGKIPNHGRWIERLRAGTASVDGLCTAAALASFTADQAALDGRIRTLIA